MNELEYTWDENKRRKTLQERGLDFADMKCFEWETALTIEDIRQDYRETRYSSKGYMKGVLVSLAWCWRNGTIRLISMRKANKRERKFYENQTSY